MKRFLLVFVALVMMMGMVSFARAEGEAEEAFEGVWVCDRATMMVVKEEEGFRVSIIWASSFQDVTEWNYSCFYQAEDHVLSAVPTGTRTEYVYDDNGDVVSSSEVYNDGEAIFSLDEEGYLLWQDEKENAGDGMKFELMSTIADFLE